MAATDGCTTACATTCEWFTATGLVTAAVLPLATRRTEGDDGSVTDGSMPAAAAPRWPAVVAGEATTGSAVWWAGTVRVGARRWEGATCAAGLGRGRLVRTGMARDEEGEGEGEEEEEQGGGWWRACATGGALGSVLMRTAWSRGCGCCGCCWGGADGARVAAAGGAAGVARPRRRLEEESLPPRKGGDRDEQGEEDDEEEAGDWTSTSRGTHDDEKDDDEGEWGAVCGEARPEDAARFFLPRLGGRVNAGGLDFLRGFLGLGSEAILL